MGNHFGSKRSSYAFRSVGIGYEIVRRNATRCPSSHDVREAELALSTLEDRYFGGALLEDTGTWNPRRDVRSSGLQEALERGELSVTRFHCGLVGAGDCAADDRGPEEEAIPLLSLARDWIEIRLVDELGAPVPRAAYELRLPNGSLLTGRLDAEGKLHLEDLPAGSCELVLTEETLPRRKPADARST